MRGRPPRVTVCSSVAPPIRAALERLAAQERRTLSNYVETVLADHVRTTLATDRRPT